MSQEKEQKILNGRYTLTKTLGQGLNGKVLLGIDNITEKEVAIKLAKLKENAEANIKTLINENKILQELDHPNIIKVLELNENGVIIKPDGTKKTVCYAALELATNGEVFEYLSTCGKFPEDICRALFKQQIDAMFYIHNQSFCHRDLKPENIFFDEDFNIKVADFGFATCLGGHQGDSKLKTIVGTEYYMAPEIAMAQNSYKGIPIDLFSCAVILFVFMTGKPCHKIADPNDVHYKLLTQNKHVHFWKQHMISNKQKFDKHFIDLINSMLAFDPLNRPTIPEIQSSEWLKGKTATKEEVKDFFMKCKSVVDKVTEQQKLKEDKQKLIQKNARLNMQNLAFGNIQATRGDGDDPDRQIKKAKIQTELNKIDFESYKFNLADLKESRKPSVIVSGLDSKDLLEVQFFCTDDVADSYDYDLAKGKFNMTNNFDGISSKVGFKIYETENGLKIIDFTKKKGPGHTYNEFFNLFKNSFEEMTTEEIKQE